MNLKEVGEAVLQALIIVFATIVIIVGAIGIVWLFGTFVTWLMSISKILVGVVAFLVVWLAISLLIYFDI
jgi:hypothetical protein